jgi:vanillate O-demethylase ferredoxin subunit
MLDVKIASRRVAAQDIVTFELVAADGSSLPAFEAGSHIDVHIRSDLIRQYSLCNAPSETHRYVISVLLEAEGRGGSTAMHAEMHEGKTIAISEPRNNFALHPQADRHLLLAGGIGVTPVLSMARHMSAVGQSFQMHYCVRAPERAAFSDELSSGALGPHVQMHFDNGPASQRLDLKELLADPVPGTHLYFCGPKGFMDAVKRACSHWPENTVHWESFAVDRDVLLAGAKGFEIRLMRSQKSFFVPEYKTVLDVMRDHGMDVETSCEMGICGTCLTNVLEGIPDHRDEFLSDAEKAANDRFTPCCSRSKTKILVVDL